MTDGVNSFTTITASTSIDITGSTGLILSNDETITNAVNGTVLINGEVASGTGSAAGVFKSNGNFYLWERLETGGMGANGQGRSRNGVLAGVKKKNWVDEMAAKLCGPCRPKKVSFSDVGEKKKQKVIAEAVTGKTPAVAPASAKEVAA